MNNNNNYQYLANYIYLSMISGNLEIYEQIKQSSINQQQEAEDLITAIIPHQKHDERLLNYFG